VADLLTLDPNSAYGLFDRHTITDEEERSWNQKSPAEKGGPTGSSFIDKTSFCSKMNPLPSGKHRIASHQKAVRYCSQICNNALKINF
jgi:hypothetical protein